MTDSTEKKDVLDVVIASGQLQMAMASEALALLKASCFEGTFMLPTSTAEKVVLSVFLNAFQPRKMDSFKDNILRNSGGDFPHHSLADAVAPALAAHLEKRTNDRRAENVELVAALKAPSQKSGG